MGSAKPATRLLLSPESLDDQRGREMRGYARVTQWLVLAGVLVAVAVTAAGKGSTAASGQARWVITDLGTLGGKSSEAVAINDQGQVIGFSATAKGRNHAFLWREGKLSDLGVLPGGSASGASAINEHGQIVGWSGNANTDAAESVNAARTWTAKRRRSVAGAELGLIRVEG